MSEATFLYTTSCRHANNVFRMFFFAWQKYGEELMSGEGAKFTKKVTVFLNPTANKR